MNSDLTRFASLLDELEISHELITSGFGSLQEINFGNDLYHVPHQLMASGLERLMKCYISLVYADQNGSYPDTRYMKKLSHDLDKLLQNICAHFYGGTTRPLVKRELTFIRNDHTLRECSRILSLFGKKGRYYNIDIIAGSSASPIDPKSEWQALELSIEDCGPYLHNHELLYRDYYPRVHSKLIAILERLVRSIALQFTIGDHADADGRLIQVSNVFSDFRNLRDEQLGTIDYRRSVPTRGQEGWNWIERSEEEVLDGEWPARRVSRTEFEGEWPFRVGDVIVECQSRLYCIVNIEGYAFALNGAAEAYYRILSPHDAGLAILGKSISPFIDLAFSLCSESDSPGSI